MTLTMTQPSTITGQPATIGFGNVLRSEWTKLRSLRSTSWCASFVVLSVVGLAVFLGVRWSRQQGSMPDGFDATNVSLSGVYLAQIVLGAFGVLAISSEYTTGMIRTTFSAVPQRRTVLAAKALVVASSALALGEIVSFVAFGIGQALLTGKHAGVSLADPGVFTAVFGAGFFLAAVTLLGFGLGATIRHTAGALSAFFGILFAPNAIVDLLPTGLRNDIINYLPMNAGNQILVTTHTQDALAPWSGFGVFCVYVAVALLAGFTLVRTRDA